jgi:hypothetical protein
MWTPIPPPRSIQKAERDMAEGESARVRECLKARERGGANLLREL